MSRRSKQAKKPKNKTLADTVSWLSEGARIPDSAADEVRAALRATGIIDEIAEWESERRGRGGRPSTVSAEAILVGALLAAFFGSSVNCTDIAAVLYQQLNPKKRAALGVADCAPGVRPYERVLRRFKRLISYVDPSDEPKNSRQRVEPRRQRSQQDRDLAAARLQRLSNAIIEASVAVAPPEFLAAWDGSLAVDATALGQYTRPGADGTIPTDPDAGYYVRTNPDSSPTDKRARAHKSMVAYETEIAVMGSGHPTDPYQHPNLVLGIRLHRPGVEPGLNATRVIDYIAAKYGKVGWLAADRAYNNSIPEKFQIAMRRLGYKLLFDYRIDQLGVQAQQRGAILVEGTWYCPSMPQPLINATLDFRNNDISEELWHIRIAERVLYELRASDSAHGRLACPATGSSPSVGCPVRHGDNATVKGKTLITVVAEPLGAICTNKKDVTFDLEAPAGAKHAQAVPYGSRTWELLYGRLRNVIEGTNGVAKDGANAGVGDACRRRLRGLANQTVLVSAMIAGSNMRRIRNWIEEYVPEAASSLVTIVRKTRTRPKKPAWLVGRRERLRYEQPPPDTVLV
ncbi:MAG TPA: hypothetical protein VHD87_02770 [Acidimicrobiales bacterium]|nr:hypothetical protein [Acidimicrobiales bacterium]